MLTIRPCAFRDGHPVTPAAVVCSLGRDMNVKLGGFYVVIFDRVRSIAATGARQVRITLTQPDYWLPDQMASIGGIVIEGSLAQKKGQNYGTPAVSITCTGAYTRLLRVDVPCPGWGNPGGAVLPEPGPP